MMRDVYPGSGFFSISDLGVKKAPDTGSGYEKHWLYVIVCTPTLPVALFRNRVAILEQGNEYLYEDIYMRSWDLAKGLLGTGRRM
jgi:hypothetical protein